MTRLDQGLPRRSVIKGAGLGLVAAGLAGALPTARADASTLEGGEIWSSEYWTKKGDIPLWIYRKRIGAPKAGESSRPAIFFVHGSSVSSRVFDLDVPGHGEYSVMNVFAKLGYDVWTMDHENYGRSSQTQIPEVPASFSIALSYVGETLSNAVSGEVGLGISSHNCAV